MAELKEQIEALFAKSEFTSEDRAVYEQFKTALRRGEIRSAEKDTDGNWHANAWVKQGILLGFRMGRMVEMSMPSWYISHRGLSSRKRATFCLIVVMA